MFGEGSLTWHVHAVHMATALWHSSSCISLEKERDVTSNIFAELKGKFSIFADFHLSKWIQRGAEFYFKITSLIT